MKTPAPWNFPWKNSPSYLKKHSHKTLLQHRKKSLEFPYLLQYNHNLNNYRTVRKRSEGRERRHEEGIYSYMTATLWQYWPWMFGILGMKIENGIKYLWLALKMYWSIKIFHKDLMLRKAAEKSSAWPLCFRESKMHLLLLFFSFLQLITENSHTKGRKAAYLLLLSPISEFKHSKLDLTETVQRRRDITETQLTQDTKR